MKIKIKGLFGGYSNEIDLSNRCNILIGENGIGKTTTLKIIYNLLTFNFVEITKYYFKSIEIQEDKDIIELYYEDFLPDINLFKINLMIDHSEKFTEDIETIKLVNELQPATMDGFQKNFDFDGLIKISDLTENEINMLLNYKEKDSRNIDKIYYKLFLELMIAKGISNEVKRLVKNINANIKIEEYIDLIKTIQARKYIDENIMCFENSKIYNIRNEIIDLIKKEKNIFL